MEQNLVLEAFKFMVLGMGVVFFFLVIMVYAIKLQAFLINKFSPVKKEEKQNTKVQKPQATISDTSKKVAAIAAVIQHHNNLKG